MRTRLECLSGVSFARLGTEVSTYGALCETKIALTARAETFNLVGRYLSFRHVKLLDDEPTLRKR